MKHILFFWSVTILLTMTFSGCQHKAELFITKENDTLYSIKPSSGTPYLIVPIDDKAPMHQLYAFVKGKMIPYAKLRLAVTEAAYYVSVAVPANLETFLLNNVSEKAFYFGAMKASYEPVKADVAKSRPLYHYTPVRGWMGRPSSAIRVGDKYHLFYETNPHGIMAENIHWGHAVSNNLTQWEEMPLVFGGDSIGESLGGSVVVDHRNIFGAGKDAIIAMYTASRYEGELRHQEQCLAYSTDGGNSFQKFVTNPVLRTYDDNPDFRHPSVVRYQKGNVWETVISCGEKLRIYSSDDLGNWNLESYIDDASGERLCSYEVGEHLIPLVSSSKMQHYEYA